ncbi:hypothetical protein B0A50_07683 [Salinomyces thailandicus]|uniref:Uncharacterized protein n=1 Tax=Salinomyces thailandicus TaxID=706561 RepID=A0A4U0TLV4_9PEZI|nr:hypothetical protein B0A50_07683 [Salinomyces thailandica]
MPGSDAARGPVTEESGPGAVAVARHVAWEAVPEAEMSIGTMLHFVSVASGLAIDRIGRILAGRVRSVREIGCMLAATLEAMGLTKTEVVTLQLFARGVLSVLAAKAENESTSAVQ